VPKDDEMVIWGWPKDQSRYLANLWLKYKIQDTDFERFWAQQDGKCACGKEFAHPLRQITGRMGYMPQVDHEHRKDADGEELPCEHEDVRGLLCQRCNRLLGTLRDNKDILLGLLKHLQRHGRQREISDEGFRL